MNTKAALAGGPVGTAVFRELRVMQILPKSEEIRRKFVVCAGDQRDTEARTPTADDRGCPLSSTSTTGGSDETACKPLY